MNLRRLKHDHAHPACLGPRAMLLLRRGPMEDTVKQSKGLLVGLRFEVAEMVDDVHRGHRGGARVGVCADQIVALGMVVASKT